jgi:DNA-binding response OmpR family regulator
MKTRKLLFVEHHSIFAPPAMIHFLSAQQATVVPSLSAARANLAADQCDLLSMDYDLADGKGEELVRAWREAGNKILMIGVSAREAGRVALPPAGVNKIGSKMEFNRIQELI